LKPIDTARLAETVRSILKAHKITVALLASEVVGINENSLSRMLCKLRLWSNNSEYKKFLWQKMYQWSHSVEAIQSLGKKGSQYKKKRFANCEKLPDVPPNLELNTAQVAQSVKEILTKKCIPLNLFGKQVVSLGRAEIGVIFRKPTPWTECNELKRKLYFRMQQWSQSAEEIQFLESTRDSKWNKTHFSSFKSLPDVPSDLQLDTENIYRIVDGILKRESISRGLFAKEVVYVHISNFARLFNNIAWNECTEYRKKLFLKIHQWSQSTEQIQSLKALQDLN
jgi:hypothetical protein